MAEFDAFLTELKRLAVKLSLVTLLGLVALTLAFCAPAHAQGRNCADRAMIVERLASGYGETRQSVGLAMDGSLVEVFAALDTGTWSILMTSPGRPTCLVAAGTSFEALPHAGLPDPAPIAYKVADAPL